MGNKINHRRTERMRQKSDAELKRFIEAKTLSSAAAAYEFERRNAAKRGE